MTTSTSVERVSDRAFYAFAAVVSVVALSVIGWILLVRSVPTGGGLDLTFMPAVNAALNGLAATLLTAGWVAVRRRRYRVHQYLMIAAFGASTLFLVGYLAYHWVHGDTRYPGAGVLRGVYLAVLATHVLLSMAVVPLSLVAFFLAFKRSFARHRRVARVLVPIWLYVSVTGVVIFFMLRSAVAAAASG